MIETIEITGVKYDVNTPTRRYVLKKLGRLDRFLPRHARRSVVMDVTLRQVNRDHGNKYEAEVVMTVPDKQLTAKDSTMNMMAAIDIVEAKITSQLRKYKQATHTHMGHRRLLRRAKHIGV